MIDLYAVARWSLVLWCIAWPLAYAYAAAENTDLSARLETRTESHRVCMTGVRRMDALVGSIEEHHEGFVGALSDGLFGGAR